MAALKIVFGGWEACLQRAMERDAGKPRAVRICMNRSFVLAAEIITDVARALAPLRLTTSRI
ncbi:hypothetical protein BRAS3843_1180005 [Bradyrhizobium sp. STM 3843]|nr:hypothetical protein BRAS3843_1180005 [Bradyrhizobium sp. STM 3843]